MGTKNNPGKFDCYANAHPDEPMFVLLGRDKHAPTLVWLWAALRALDGEDAAKVHESRELVGEMFKYQNGLGKETLGIGVAVLAGMMELVKAANFNIDKLIEERGEEYRNNSTTVAEMRLFMAALRLEK